MILTLRDKHNSGNKDGSDLPMLSRSGKSTISQYLSFSKHKPNKIKPSVEVQINNNDEEQPDEGFGNAIGEKRQDIALAMQKIADEDKAERLK